VPRTHKTLRPMQDGSEEEDDFRVQSRSELAVWTCDALVTIKTP